VKHFRIKFVEFQKFGNACRGGLCTSLTGFNPVLLKAPTKDALHCVQCWQIRCPS